MIAGETVDEFENGGENVEIRYPEVSDAEGMMKLINSLVDENAMVSNSERKTFEEELEWLADDVVSIEKGEKTKLVLTIDGEIMGYSGVSWTKENHVASFNIALKKPARGRGLGERLMKVVVDESYDRMGYSILKLRVYGSNTPAVNLYKKLGFKEAGRIPDGLEKDGEFFDEVVMYRKME